MTSKKILMGELLLIANRMVTTLSDLVGAIVMLSTVIKEAKEIPYTTTVQFNNVVWLDDTGSYVLIWYADGTGQILHVEGRVTTVSTVGRPGKTCYKLSDGREMVFDRKHERGLNE